MISLENELYIEFPSALEYIDIVSSQIISGITRIIQDVNEFNSSKAKSSDEGFGIGVFGFGLSLAIDEALKNAIIHGNRKNPRLTVVFNFLIAEEFLEITVRDQGQGFDYSKIQDVDIDAEAGRGLLLIRNFMDEVKFNKSGNEITMIKNRK